MPQRGIAYQPRVKPWVWGLRNARVLEVRRIWVTQAWVAQARILHLTICGVPSERGDHLPVIPRVSPWAGMWCPLGAREMPRARFCRSLRAGGLHRHAFAIRRYAAFLQNAGIIGLWYPRFHPGPVCGAPWGHGECHAHAFADP